MTQAAVERQRRQEDRSATGSPSCFLFSTLASQFEPALGSHNLRMGLGSAPEKGETICEHTLQDQLPAFWCSRSGFGDSSSRRWTAGLGWRDRQRLFDHCGDNDVRDCRLIRFHRDGGLSSGAEAVDALLGSLLLILSFDQRCLRYQKKWHVFPQSF